MNGQMSAGERLRWETTLFEEQAQAAGIPWPMTVERFVLEHGREYEPQRRPKGFRRMKANVCFRNAYFTAEKHGLTYVEGFALLAPYRLWPIHHAWCADDAGRVVDVTWEEPEQCSYFGVPFHFDLVERVTMRARYYVGVLMPRGYFVPSDFEAVSFGPSAKATD